MSGEYASDFERGCNYARRIYRELADGYSTQTVSELARALLAVTGSEAELARGIAAGLEEMARAEKQRR